jgi:hypothetical protein
MDSQRQQAAGRIKQSNNILVTVSNNPSVDQLAACIGLTVSLNKMGKHATAVFSGEVPSTLEFLQPEKTIEKNTDSLRDFIIALDKSKADKLRYKVEDRVVKIFITPYRTSITDKDLEFSQGDFNVDVVVALGVHNQEELDLAITSHGRILHDATVVTLNTKPGGELGSINWLDPNASSLSELAVQLVNDLDRTLVDGQVATSFLTGIVAETERFSNNKTTPQTMSISAQLMSSGANQQLVATKLQEPVAPPPPPPAPIATQQVDKQSTPEPVKKSDDGTLEITHDETKTAKEEEADEDKADTSKAPAAPEAPAAPAPQIQIDEHGALRLNDDQPKDSKDQQPLEDKHQLADHKPHSERDEDREAPKEAEAETDEAKLPAPKQSHEGEEDYLPPVSRKEPKISHHDEPPKMILEPPTLGGALTANSEPGSYEHNEGPGLPGLPTEEGSLPSSMDEDRPSISPTIMPPHDDDDDRNAPGTGFLGDQPLDDTRHGSHHDDRDHAPAAEHEDHEELPLTSGKTLSDIERDVHSSHLGTPSSDLNAAPFIPPATPPAPALSLPPTPPMAPAVPTPPAPDPIIDAFSNNQGAVLPPVNPTAPNTDGSLDALANLQSQFADDNPTSVPDMPVPDTTPPINANTDINSARDAVAQAMGGATQQNLEPIQALNAQPMDLPVGGAPNAVPPVGPAVDPATQPVSDPMDNLTPAWNPNAASAGPVPASQGQGPAPVAPTTPQFATPPPPMPVFSPQGPATAGQFAGNGLPPQAPPPMMPPTPPMG